ncbi:hypothetical protein [Prosthecomicrobium sp. N25]|uniref:hypothetical protein n=1 Tax=Prosthecomicrobium sp. N25 TaxID=3129254 RepID=UPI0030785018
MPTHRDGRKPRSRSIDLILANGAGGALAGSLFAAGVLASDGAGLGSLLAADASPVAAGALWMLGVAAGFATFGIATAVMSLRDDGPGAGPGRLAVRPIPVSPRPRR